MPPFIHLLERGTLSNLFLKRKVNVLTSKLKTRLGGGQGSTGRVLRVRAGEEEVKEEAEEEQGRKAMRLRRPSNRC